MLFSNPFFLLVCLIVLGLALSRFGLLDHLKKNRSEVESWFSQSNWRTFGIPFAGALVLSLGFYLFGGIAIIAKLFAYGFIGFILFNLVYRVSGRHDYRLMVQVSFMFVFFGSLISLALFNLG